jgi:DNA-damage-inducible protein D
MAAVFRQKQGVTRDVAKAYEELVDKGVNRCSKIEKIFVKFVKREPTKKEVKELDALFSEAYVDRLGTCPLFKCTNILKEIRRIWHEEEWWFVATDIIIALTDSKDPKGYLKDMRRRDDSFSQGWGQIATPLSIQTSGGIQKLNCLSTKGAFRLIQSIPSKKAEPFKQWLAKVGHERVQEIENPELAQKRMREIYKAKGYSDEWVEKRVRGIAIREELTNEWGKRGIEGKEYAILTAEISKATFGITPNEHKKFKGLERENLRDHMDDLELIFSMLGEKVSTEITKKKMRKAISK